MRLSALLASLTLVALLFAGCSGDGGGDGGEGTSSSSSSSASQTSSTSSSVSATGTTSSASSTSTGASANTAPAGSVSVSINATNATFSLAGTDADQDPLSWTLDFGDGSANATGTDLPANETHTYAVGNYTANFTLTDGTDSRHYTVAIEAVAGGAAGATRQVVDASYTIANTGCADPPPMAAFGTPLGGLVWAEWEVDPATIGHPFKVDVTSLSPVGTVFGLAFYDDGDEAIAGSGGVGTNTLSGLVSEGAVHGLVTDCGGVAEVAVHYEAGPGVVA